MSFTIKGLDKVLNNLKKFGEEAEDKIEKTTKLSAQDIVLSAKQKAPVDVGTLYNSIFEEKAKEKKSVYTVYVGGNAIKYAAYVEFGTGAKVSVPPELQKEASKFKGRGGDFDKGLQSIKDWCKRKGIEEDAAYPIFMAILKRGLTPQPYLYPAWIEGRNSYLEDLKDLLKTLTKKYS